MLATAAPPPALPAVKVQSAWVASARTTRVMALSVSGVPATARVVLVCRGGGCPFRRKPVATHGGARVSLTRAFRHVRLRLDAQVEVRVSDATGTMLVRFLMRSGKAPVKERWLLDPPKTIVLGPAPAPAPAPAPGSPPAGPPAVQPGASKGHWPAPICSRATWSSSRIRPAMSTTSASTPATGASCTRRTPAP